MLLVHQRLAELWVINSKRDLTDDEQSEMAHCLNVNATYIRKLAELHNLSLMASMTDDTDWQHEICREIDQLDAKYGVKAGL